MVSSKDATEINARYAKGNGLMRGGASVNNMLNGDAEKSILTLSDLKSGISRGEEAAGRGTSTLLAVNPYFLMRTLVLMFGDALLEITQYLKARVAERAAAPGPPASWLSSPARRPAPCSCATWLPT